MVETAIATGDPEAVETVLRIAREAHPGARARLDEIGAQWRVQLASAASEAPLQPQAAPPEEQPTAVRPAVWKGQIELGASRSTGRTGYLGAIGSVDLERDGARWRHKLHGRLELQKGPSVADVERSIFSWQPGYKFAEELYAYGLGQFEADPTQGYGSRYTAGAGVGYTVLQSEVAKLELEGGPAFRHVEPVDDAAFSTLAARASLNLRWAIAPTLELKQAAALYVEGANTNASALTGLEAQLIGPLKARLSYDVRYESSAATSGQHLDTLSRATLVYSF